MMKIRGDIHVQPNERTLPLTSENLKKFEKQYQRRESLYSTRKIPQRTAADGKSEQKSVVSIHGDERTKNDEQTIEKKQIREGSRTFYRPDINTVRRNPEGRSQNGSLAAPAFANATKIYYDDTDDRIPYEDPEYVVPNLSRAANDQGIEYETSSYSSSSLSVVVKTKKIKRRTPSDGSVPSSTSASSSDGEFLLSEDDGDTTSEDQTTIITNGASTTFYTRSTSSVSSVSSIPTKPSSDSSSGNEEELEPKAENQIVEEVIPKQITPPPTVQEIRPESSISETSIRLGNYISEGHTTRKDSVSSGVLSRQSYITIRNWTRWGTYSQGGYSIADKIVPFNRRNRTRSKGSKSSSSSWHSASNNDNNTDSESDESNTSESIAEVLLPSRSRASTLKKSLNNSSSSEEENPEDTEGNSEDESEDSEDGTEEVESSSESLTSDVKNSQAVISKVDIRESNTPSNNDMRKSSVRVKKQRRREKENDVEGYDFKYRTKKIPKLRNRPPRPKGGLNQVPPSKDVGHRQKRRKRKDKKTNEIFPTDREDALSTFTSSSYTPPLHRKPKLAAVPPKIKSSLSMTSTDLSSVSRNSSAASNDMFRGRKKKNQLRPLNVNDSGFVSDGTPSSCGSMRPVETPFTPVARKISALSLRSIIVSDDSGCSSYYRESDSCLSRSASSCSLSSEGESTVLGPEKQPPTPPPLPPPRTAPKKTKRKKTPKENAVSENTEENPKELPPVRTVRCKSSPYHASMMPAIIAKMKDLRESIKKAEEKQKKKRVGKRKVVRVNHPMPSFQEAYRDIGMKRFVKLAKPKESKAVWATSFWPVRWGDQTMVFPLSKTAVKFQTTPRLGELAVSKKDFRKTDYPETLARDAFQFSCGRSSVVLEVSPMAMKGNASARVIELAKHKTTMKEFEERQQRTNYIFGCGRSSPIWDVSEGARATEERERTMQLAGPKKPDSRYQPERPCIWPVSTAAQRTSPSSRIEMLARPKTRQDRLHREPTWRVSSAAVRTVASGRVQELAKPKLTAEGYEPCREIAQPLSRSVLRAGATERIKTLSKPNIRETMDHVQFNPDAFKVSEAALKGRIPDRIAELSQPLARN